jgi:hypothetical protein
MRRGSPSHWEVCQRRQRGRMTHQRQHVGRETGDSWSDVDTGTPYAQKITQGRRTNKNGGLAYGEQW